MCVFVPNCLANCFKCVFCVTFCEIKLELQREILFTRNWIEIAVNAYCYGKVRLSKSVHIIRIFTSSLVALHEVQILGYSIRTFNALILF